MPQLGAAPRKEQARYKAVLEQRTLRIEGTDADETIIAEVGGEPASINIDYRAADSSVAVQRASFLLNGFDRLVINARGGADFVNIIDPTELLTVQKKILKLDGGVGENVVVISHLPFKRQTATEITRLLDLSKQLEDVATRASEATSQALTNDAMKLVEDFRINLADPSREIAATAQKQLLDPTRQLLERSAPQLIEEGKSITTKIETLGKQHTDFVMAVAKKHDPTNGVFPPDDDREPDLQPDKREGERPEDIAKEKEMDAVLARAEQLTQMASELADDAKARIERMSDQVKNEAGVVEKRAEEFERRAEQLSATADKLAEKGEKDARVAADRVVAVVAELKFMEKNFQAVAAAFDEEFRMARSFKPEGQKKASGPSTSRAPGQPGQPAAGCNSLIATTHTYTGSGFFFPIGAVWASWSITGGAGPDILVGGMIADDIHGGAGFDWIFGLSGDDHIHGDSGTDVLCGEFVADVGFTGNDCIWGDDGTDLIFGDNIFETSWGTPGGDDHLVGGKGIDIVVGDDAFPDIFSQTLPGGKDEIEGNDDIDILFGCGGPEKIDGNDDMDFAEGNGGDDTINGGAGRNFSICNTALELGNLLLGGDGNDTVTGGSGIDLILGDRHDDKLTGADQLDAIFGGPGKDTVDGNSGGIICIISGIPIRLGNFIAGGPDADTLRAGGDLDFIHGGDHDDDIRGYDGSLQKPLALDADILVGSNGNDYLEGDQEQLLLVGSIDFIVAGPGDDVVHGGKDPDLIWGNGGADTIYGDSNALTLPASWDLIWAGPDADWITGGNGTDLILGQDGNDTIFGDDETFGLISLDLLIGGPGNDTMNGGLGLDVMLGRDGDDDMLGDSNFSWEPLSVDVMFGESGMDTMDGGNALDVMLGGPDCDTMMGDNSTPGRISPDLIDGGAGNDRIDGGNNPDLILGGQGDDELMGDRQLNQPFSLDLMMGEDGCDTMYGGDGADFMLGGAGMDRMEGQSGPDLLRGGPDSDTISGGDWPDVLMGDDGNDLIHGDDWPDIIVGGKGDDCLSGDNGVDFIFGGDDKDCLHGDNAPDLLRGDGGDDLMFGDSGFDFLLGGNGDDKLDGGSGPDLLVGNSGTDECWSGFFAVCETKHSGSSGLSCNCAIDLCTGKICVHKFNDLNGDGVQNSGEPNLQGWQFQISSSCTSATLTTDANGNACADFLPGTYSVVEQVQGGWGATTPTTHTATVSSGQTVNLNFGNKLQQGLCLRKFNDLNGNGILDSGEPPLPNWSFTVTLSSGAVTTMTTDPTGQVCGPLPPGNCTIVEQVQAGWTATTPTTQATTISAGQIANVRFGNQNQQVSRGEICITKFDDKNRNGQRDPGEMPLPNWSFTITDSTGGSTVVTTLAPTGEICTGFPVGTYTVTETPQAGWTATTPNPQTVTLTPGQISPVSFGNAK